MRRLAICSLLALSLIGCRDRTQPASSCPEGMTQVIPNVCDDEVDTVFIDVRDMSGKNTNNILWLKREWQKKYPKKEIVAISFGYRTTELLIQYEQRIAR